MTIAEVTSQWWTRHQIPMGRTSFWQIGPLHLWVQRLPHQWHFAWEHDDDWLDPTIRVIPLLENERPPDHTQQIRFTFKDASNELSLAPALADRPLVTALETPIQVLPGEEIVLYVSSPLWLRAEMTDPPKHLTDIPTFRMSDTWFGQVTSLGGELAYASQTLAVFQLQDVPFRPHCAITAVRVRNSGESPLPIDRLNLPMPRLSLFYSPRSGFWTDTITLERREDQEFAGLRLDHAAPPEAAPTQFVAAPRIGDDTSHVVRAFSSIFRNHRGDQ
jgi:hypothetical protein